MGSITIRYLRIIGLSLGVFFSYLIYGILQEKITKSKYGTAAEDFNYYFSLLLFQCVVNCLFAKLALWYSGDKTLGIPEKSLALCGFTYIGAMFTSNYSLKYVDYPLQVIGKSVKPIPIMVLSVLFAKQKYPLLKYIFVSMISLGVILFIYKDHGYTRQSVFGFGESLLIISLIMDGLTGAIQESIREHKLSAYAMMLRLNMWSTVYLCLALAFSTEGFDFVHFISRHPSITVYMMLFGVTSAVGQMFIFSLLTNYGPLLCSIVTTSRKFFTVLASVIMFSHPLTNRQWLGTGLVFSGLILDQVYDKTRKAHKVPAACLRADGKRKLG